MNLFTSPVNSENKPMRKTSTSNFQQQKTLTIYYQGSSNGNFNY
jgi:hypothetical protein